MHEQRMHFVCTGYAPQLLSSPRVLKNGALAPSEYISQAEHDASRKSTTLAVHGRLTSPFAGALA